MKIERTLLVIKPDAVQRRLAGEIMSRVERKGLRIAAAKLMQLSREQAEDLYSPHRAKPFFAPLIEFMTSSPILAMVVVGRDAIGQVRRLNGATSSLEADVGTVRGDYGMSTRFNLVHGSDAPESAEREIAVLFQPDEIIDYKSSDERWILED